MTQDPRYPLAPAYLEHETHGLADVAAQLAGDAWEASAAARKLEGLLLPLHQKAEAVFDVPALAGLEVLPEAVLLAVQAGARMGYLLATVEPESRQGWQAWWAAALEASTRAGCVPGTHLQRIEHSLDLSTSNFIRERSFRRLEDAPRSPTDAV